MKNWKKSVVAAATALLLGVSLMGCGAKKAESGAAESATTASATAESASATGTAAESAAAAKTEAGAGLRVGALKGPTAMGLAALMQESQDGKSEGSYQFTVAAQPDEIAAKLVSGDLDIALLPANMAAALYNKTEGKIAVLNINTLGVLYCVTGDENIHSVKDLAGKTVLTTGQGATPEYVLRYLLQENGVTDCTLEFKSEPTEIASALAADPAAIAVLPQPFVTVAEAKNDKLKTAFSLSDSWDALNKGSRLVTGVTVVRQEVLKAQPDAVKTFREEQARSAATAVQDPAAAAKAVVAFGILENEGIAKKALPACNITNLDGAEMKQALSGYLQVLYSADPKAVGGKLPDDAFYIVTE